MEKDKSIMGLLSDLKELSKRNEKQKNNFSVSDIFDTLKF